jgi:hypothetical protein
MVELQAMEDADKWTTFNICSCHFPVGSFFRRDNGQVGIYDDARPLTGREFATSTRLPPKVRAQAHRNPSTPVNDASAALAETHATAAAEVAALRCARLYAFFLCLRVSMCVCLFVYACVSTMCIQWSLLELILTHL